MTLSALAEEMQRKAAPQDDTEELADLAVAAAAYVSAVIEAELARTNIRGEDAGAWRARAERTDRARTAAHNTFISETAMVNRLCTSLGIAPLYEGEPSRRELGDLAIALTEELFRGRA